MYLIANATSSFVEIPDLGASLKPKQAMDLHAMGYKGKAESSSDLAKAIKNGWIKVLKKDAPKKVSNKKVIERTHTEKIIDNSINKEEILGSIRKIIQEELKGIKSQENQDIPDNLIGILSELVRTGTSTRKANSSGIDNEEVEDDDIGLEKLTEIHTKVANKLMKDVSSSVNYKEEEIKDDSMRNRLSELEDLL